MLNGQLSMILRIELVNDSFQSKEFYKRLPIHFKKLKTK